MRHQERPVQDHDANKWSARERLAALAGFSDHMTPENMEELRTSVWGTSIVSVFQQLAYDHEWVSPRADWPNWLKSPQASRMFETPELILTFDINALTSLVTMMVRRERFCEGTLPGTIFYLAGYITTRAAQLLAELERPR